MPPKNMKALPIEGHGTNRLARQGAHQSLAPILGGMLSDPNPISVPVLKSPALVCLLHQIIEPSLAFRCFLTDHPKVARQSLCSNCILFRQFPLRLLQVLNKCLVGHKEVIVDQVP
jgi:hypothetical protein